MKKCAVSANFSAFTVLLVGLILTFVGDRSIVLNSLDTLAGLFPADWYVLIPPGLAFILLVVNIVFKVRRKDRNIFLPVALFLSIVAYLAVIPAAFAELISGNVPASLIFTTGAALIVLAFLALFIIGIVQTIHPMKKVDEVQEEELQEEVYEVVEEADLAPVEFVDEEVEDEEDLEEETEEEAEERKTAKKTKKDKEFDRTYHIMKRAKDDRWIVKIANRKKAIKIFDTQKEAISYAEVLAKNNNGVVRVFASKGANKGRIII